MALPKITKPIFSVKLPSNDKEVFYRPMSVKEEKILLIAQQGASQASKEKDIEKLAESAKQNMLASIQVVNNCLIEETDVKNMSQIDFEYIFVAIRAKSQSNVMEITINDEHKKKISVEVDVENIEVVRNEDHTNKIDLGNDITLIMRYPTVESTIHRIDASIDPSRSAVVQYEIMRDCLDSVVDGDSVTKFDDEKLEDIDIWMDDLQKPVLSKIEDFFRTSPILRYTFPYVNSKNEQKTLVIQGFESFFI